MSVKSFSMAALLLGTASAENTLASGDSGNSASLFPAVPTTYIDNIVDQPNGLSMFMKGVQNSTNGCNNNLFYGSGAPSFCSNNVIGNPLFSNVSIDDFHLTAGSAAIGAGVAYPDFMTDFYGLPRAPSGNMDIGASIYP